MRFLKSIPRIASANFYFAFLTKRKVGQRVTTNFDIFIFSSTLIESPCMNPFVPSAPFFYLLKVHWERMGLKFIPEKRKLPFPVFESFTMNNIKSINTGWIFIIKVLKILKVNQKTKHNLALQCFMIKNK